MTGRHPQRTVLACAGLLLVAAVAYVGLPLELLAGAPLDMSRSFQSELAAIGQPHRLVFVAADLVAGAAVVAAGVLLLRSAPGRLVRTTLGATTVFGAATMLDALTPMACATSASRACARAEAAGELGRTHELHTVTSVVADGAALVLAVLLVALTFTQARTAPVPLRGAAIVAGTVAVALSVSVSVLVLVGAPGGALPAGTGVVQRAQTAAFSVLLVLLVPLVRRVVGPDRAASHPAP